MTGAVSAGPLAGRTIALTRSADRTRALVAMLEALGATVRTAPAITIAEPESYDALDAALARAHEFEWLALTSAVAARVVAQRLEARNVSPRDAFGSALRVACVGDATASVARELLGRCDLVPRRHTADALAAALPMVWRSRVLFPCADRARDALPVALRTRGAHVHQVVAYRTIANPDALASIAREMATGAIDAALLASPSAAESLANALRRADAQAPRLVCIGPATAGRCRDLGLPVDAIASSPHDDALVDALTRCLRGDGK